MRQVLYFLCDYRNEARNNLLHILQAFTSQYLKQNREMYPVASQWVSGSAQRRASCVELQDLLQDLLKSSSEPIYLIIDGLDECADSKEQLKIQGFFQKILTGQNDGMIRFCISSRDIKLTNKFLKLVKWKVKIGKETNSHDIQSFVNSEVHKVTAGLGGNMLFTDQYINATIDKITSRADGKYTINTSLSCSYFSKIDSSV